MMGWDSTTISDIDTKCAACGGATESMKVDNGVAIIEGPAACKSCEWSEWELAGQTVDGMMHDRYGCMVRVGNGKDD